MQFESPIWFLGVGAVAVVGLLFHIRVTRGFRGSEFPSETFVDVRSFSGWRHIPFACLIIGLLSLGAALSKPFESKGEQQGLREGIDIMVLLDVSSSMLIEDFKPNRLESAKETIEAFSKKLVNDRLGLVVYSGEAFVQYPLSFDHDLLSQFLPFIQSGIMKEGTAIGVAAAYGVSRLKTSEARSKVLILLTDGDNNAGSITPEQASLMAKEVDIPIYALALGKEGKVPFPIYARDLFGNRVKQYRMVTSIINHKLLKKMAQVTRGQYFRVDEQNALAQVLAQIQSLEKSRLPELKPKTQKTYFDSIFMWLAFLIMVLGMAFEKFVMRIHV